MSINQSIKFGELYKGMWSVFTSCYGAVLGWSLLVVVVSYIAMLILGVLNMVFRAIGLPSAVGIVCYCLLMLLVIVPLAAYLKYDILRRARRKRATNGSSSEPAKSNMYSSVVLVSLFPLVLVLPGMILVFAGLPTEIRELELDAFTQNQAALQKLLGGAGQNGKGEEKEQQAKAAGKKDEANQRQNENQDVALPQLLAPSGGHPTLIGLGGLLWIIASVALLTWVPWALIALLDPRTDVTSAGAALRYARELTAGTCSGAIRWSIWGVLFVAGLIGAGSILLCCIGVFFLGFPLMFASGPGLYLAMRGE